MEKKFVDVLVVGAGPAGLAAAIAAKEDGIDNLLVCGKRLCISDVIANRAGEQMRFLKNNTYLIVKLLTVNFFNINTIDIKST